MINTLEVKNLNYWRDVIPQTSKRSLDSDLHCDYLIIGGGLSGLSVALHLKQLQPAAEVALLEAGMIGEGSSGVNSGICGTRLGPPIEKQIRLYGKKKTADIYQYSCDAMNYAASLITSLSFSCNLHSSIQWQVALTEKDLKLLESRSRLYQSLGFNISSISQAELSGLFKTSSGILGGISFPAFSLNPYYLCLALRNEIIQSGVSVFENTRVFHCPLSSTVEYKANGFSVYPKKVVYAVNASIAQFRMFSASVLPIQVFSAVTSSLRTQTARHAFSNMTDLSLFDARSMFNFIRFLPDSRILIGGEYRFSKTEVLEKKTREMISSRLKRQLAVFFPGLVSIDFEFQWHGTVGCTLDDWPIIGPVLPERLWHIGACNGHGVAASLMLGKEVAHSIVNNKHQADYPWQRSAAPSLIHPYVAGLTVPLYLMLLRHRSNLPNT